MKFFPPMFAVLLLALSTAGYANSMPQQDPDSVEEPDAPDDADTDGMQPVPQTGVQPSAPAAPPAVQTNPDQPPPAVVAPVVAAPDAPPQGDANYDGVELEGLNKVTARVEKIAAPIGGSVHFGTMDIVARRCWKSAPGERPENAALLDISETKPGEAPVALFQGWMFSSSPGLSGLEHPFYDVTVLECTKTQPVSVPDSATKPGHRKSS